MYFIKPTKALLLCIFAISSCSAMEESKVMKIKPSSLFVTQEVGQLDLFHSDEQGFSVVQDDEVYPINKHSVDPLLRTLKHKQLKKFQKCGYIQVKKNDYNEFSLVSKVRGNGGGVVLGWILYSTTKALCYGTAAAAVGGSIAVTGGAVIAAAGALAPVAGAGLAVGGALTGSAVATTTAVVASSTIPAIGVAGSIVGGSSLAGASTLTMGVVVSAGGVAGAVAAVETASCLAFAAGAACWFLP